MEAPVEEDEIRLSSKHKLEITEFTGGDGLWQRLIFVIIFFLNVPVAYHMLSMSFLAPNIDHWCARSPEFRNLSTRQWKELAMPENDQHCSRYKDFNFTDTILNGMNRSSYEIISCDSWEYDTTTYNSTILSKFDLVCGRKWLVSLSKSIFMAGFIFSLLVFGHLSDWIGRKPVIIISSCITICSALASTFSNTFTMFLILQFFIALGVTVTLSTPFVLLMEIASPNMRHVYGLAMPLGFTLGYVTLPIIAWFIRDSFWIQMVSTASCLLALTIWWIPESPRWLLNHGKVEEAYKVLIRGAKINGLHFSKDDEAALKKVLYKRNETNTVIGTKANVLDLLRTPGLWKITLNVYYNWFVNAFVYFGLSYNTNELAGDPFVNFALSGIVEIPAFLLAIFTIQSLGKRNLLAGSMVMGGIACFSSYLLPSEPSWLSVTVSMIGKFFITISFGIIYIFSNEAFPTVVRNIALGSASICARIGSVIAPFMRELGDATHPIFPQLIYGILAISSGLLVFLLPDTRNCSVPDTMEEAVQISKKSYNKKEPQKSNHLMVKLTEDHQIGEKS